MESEGLVSRISLIRDAKKIDITKFVTKNIPSISVKSKKLDELYEKYRTALQNGSAILISKARRKLLEYKIKLGSVTNEIESA